MGTGKDADKVLWLWRLRGVFGPIFDKELRVSSRRRRNYLLRFLYVLVLLAFVVMVWINTVESGYNSPAGEAAMMAEAGKGMVAAIVWFQFIALQLLAVIMLSTSISDEIYHRTLGLLMTTPIDSMQIVLGKLCGKLLQLVLLLAISLPLLAIVRALGGVPWRFVAAGLGITFSSVIFVGTVSLYFSIHNKSAYEVIFKTLFVCGAFYLSVSLIIGLLVEENLNFDRMVNNEMLFAVIAYVNPFAAMGMEFEEFANPGNTSSLFLWPVHCGLMLIGSAVVLLLSIRAVRIAALRQAVGEVEVGTGGKLIRRLLVRGNPNRAPRPTRQGAIERVHGWPVMWKELRIPLLRDGPEYGKVAMALTVLALVVTYLTAWRNRGIFHERAHSLYVGLFISIGLLCTAVLSATRITSEKESQSWPLLLGTTRSDWEIVLSKAAATFCKCLPIWVLLAGHMVLFMLVRLIHPIAGVHVVLLVVPVVVFMTGTGIYFSAAVRRTTTAVVLNVGLGFLLWMMIPGILGLLVGLGSPRGGMERMRNLSILANPFIQTDVVVGSVSGDDYARDKLQRISYRWPHGRSYVRKTTKIMATSAVLYSAAGVFFLWRAKQKLRKNIF